MNRSLISYLEKNNEVFPAGLNYPCIILRYCRQSICFTVFAFLFLMIIPQDVSAQEDATLRVLVVSEDDGNPVIGANVILLSYHEGEGEEQEILHGGATDSDGFHEFRNIEPGQYQLEISYLGHQTHQSILSLEREERRVERITLSVNIERLDELVVKSEREVTTGNAGLRRISKIDVDRIPTPGPGGDLASYLQTLPGVTSGGDRGGDLFIRGGTPAQNQVLIDNLQIVKPFHISNLFSAFPEQSIQNVDMFAGGFGAEYMGATSAVIDVNLRPGNMRTHKGSAAISPYLASLQVEGPIKNDRKSFLLIGRKSIIEESGPYFTGKEVPLNFYDVTGRYTYRSEVVTCNITGLRTFDRGQINPTRDIMLSWSNTAIGARCLGYNEDYDYPVEVTLGYTNFSNSEGTLAQTNRSAGIDHGFIKATLGNDFLGLPVVYGFEGSIQFYRAELAERFSSYDSFIQGIPNFKIYSSTEWSPGNRLTVQPSIGTQITFRTNPALEPRLRISYNPLGSDDQEVSLALGKYYQVMEGINDERDAGTVFTVWKLSEKDAPLPKALHGIIGYKHRLNDYFQVNLEGYVKKHSFIPVSKWTPEASLEIQTALANGFTHGFDVRLWYNRNPLYFFLGYSWSKVKYEAVSEELGAWIEEPIFSYSPAHDQRHKINVIGSYRFGGFTASMSWELGSGKPFTKLYAFDLALAIPYEHPLSDPGRARTLYSRPYGERLPAYHRLDISVDRTFKFSSKLSIATEIGVINLYDRNNIFYFDLNSLERVDQTPLLPYISIRTQIN